MSKKLQLALLALLGFSTACSTVKHVPAGCGTAKKEGTEEEQPAPDEQEETAPVIRLLYGVRVTPEQQKRLEEEQRLREQQQQEQQSDTPEKTE